MLQKLKDYAKCAVRNKYVIGGYAGIVVSSLMKYLEQETGTELLFDNFIGIASLGALGLTSFGKETYDAYRRMRDHIEEHGTIDERFKSRFSSIYCTQTGIRMAAEEAGLEHLI